MIGGKAKLVRDDYCDGLGDCLPACPADAIAIEEREAAPYDEAAVRRAAQSREGAPSPGASASSCPGSASRAFDRSGAGCESAALAAASEAPASRLSQWPVQIKLLPTRAPYFDGAKLLVAADCTAYAYAAFHEDFMRGRITLVGCPKLDGVDYSEKLADILCGNDVKEVLVARMEVPCCGGLEHAVKTALRASGSSATCRVVTVSTDGRILS